jgi:methionyl-tRNA formyltransferase
MKSRKPLNALFLGAPDPLSIGMIAAWLHAGNRAEAIWYPERVKATPAIQKDTRMAGVNPNLSMAGLARLFEVECEAVPKLSGNPALVAKAMDLAPDVVISVMFMDIIPKAMIAAFKGRLLNIHPSLLPAYRGPNPILNMLWDEKTSEFSGLTLHEISEGVDAGPIVKSLPVAFPKSGSMTHYLGALIPAGGKLLCEVVPAYLGGSILAKPQPRSGVSHCHVKMHELSIGQNDHRARVEWLCRTIGQFGEFRIEGAITDVRVNRLADVIGPPSGAPKTFSDNWIEMDLFDARVRLSRSQIS